MKLDGKVALAILRGPTGCHTVTERALTLEAGSAVMEFVHDQGRCPSGEAELVRERYLARVWVGPRWGNRLYYKCIAAPAGVDVEVRAAGPDHTFWTADDIVASPAPLP